MVVGQRRLGELQKEAADLGIQYKVDEDGGGFSVTLASGKKFIFERKLRGKKLGKDEYAQGLRLHYLHVQYPEYPAGAPKHLQFILGMETPMLCIQSKHMPKEWHDSVWIDPAWVAEEKINGCRMIVIYSKEEGIHFYSRNISVKDYMPVEYVNIWLKDYDTAQFGESVDSFVIDTEVLCPVSKVDTTSSLLSNKGVVTETRLQATAALLALNDEDSLRIQKDTDTQLEFFPFHVLELNGNSLLEQSYDENREIMNVLWEFLEAAHLNIVRVRFAINDEKKALYDAILAEGGEGLVMKDVHSHYVPTESRYHRMWVKMKRTASETYGDTIDGFVTGFLLGKVGTGFEKLVGALKVTVYLNKIDGTQAEWEIAHVPNLALEQRKQMTELDANGNPQLKQEWLYKVVEVDGQWFSARNRRLMHAKLVRFRDDKSPEQCVFDEAIMNSMIIGAEVFEDEEVAE